MTAPTIPRRPRVPTGRSGLAGSRPRADTTLLIVAAGRGAITREVRRPWPVYLVNGQPSPDARPVIAGLIDDGLLYVAAPDAAVSAVVPTVAGLAKIGVSA